MPRSAVPLLGAAMLIFVLTVVIGILNGLDLWKVPHGALLAHVHAGTLGWITLSVFAGAVWVFGANAVPKALVWLSIVSVYLYVGAFYGDLTKIRPFTGTLMLVAIVWFAAWASGARRGRPLTVPGLSMLLALVNLVIGAVLGVLLGLMLSGMLDLPDGVGGAHPAMMVVGYLIIAAAGVSEQLVNGPGADKMTRGGMIQSILFFLAGIILAVGVLLDLQPLLGLNLLFEVIGVVMAITRNRHAIAGAGWGAESPARRGATSLLFLIPALIILGYLIVTYSKNIESAPRGLFLALDHATFIGVLTNAIFGLLLVATAARRAVAAWADQIVYWGTNLGLIAFLVGLIAEIAVLKRIGTPIMGLSILLGLAVAAMRLGGGSNAAETAKASPAA